MGSRCAANPSYKLASIVAKAERKVKEAAIDNTEAHPRIVSKILEEGSWVDDDEVQEMWAGLLASSCGEADESNLVFVNLLSQLTSLQVRILQYACKNAPKYCGENELIMSGMGFRIGLEELRAVAGESNIHRLDRELDHLRGLELIHGGFSTDIPPSDPEITPTSLALSLYVRAQGSHESPREFFDLPILTASDLFQFMYSPQTKSESTSDETPSP
jgi:Abortive infection alpha